MTRIVHTADWHLGARLVDHDRLPEQAAFLDWLIAQLTRLRPDLLIVAGDIFDGTNPPQEALALYYRFLARLSAEIPCRILILGGNHDSPATLHAPRQLLSVLRIDVHGSTSAEPSEAVIEVGDFLICAVPFLRERDIRQAAPGQTYEEVAAAMRAGIERHYRRLFEAARLVATQHTIIATGHLTTVGRQSSPSERDIHIGNLGAVSASCFEGFAYTALGHIHRPQAVGGEEHIRYAGSPIALSFSETDHGKEIRIIDVEGRMLVQSAIEIPIFRPLLRLTSSAATLALDLAAVQGDPTAAFEPWVELTVTDAHLHPDLDRQVRDASAKLRLQVLKVIAAPPEDVPVVEEDPWAGRVLVDLQPGEIFAERLRREPIELDSPEGQELTGTFAELLSHMDETAATEEAPTA